MRRPDGSRLQKEVRSRIRSSSGLLGLVQAGNAEGERRALSGLEAIGTNEGLHFRAGGKAFDGAAEVFIGGTLAGDPAGDAGHDVLQIEEIELAEAGEARDGEIEDEEAAAGAEDAAHFLEGERPGGHVSQSKADGEHVEGSILKREAQPISGDEAVEAAFLRLAHHGNGKIGPEDFGGGTGGLDGLGEIATAGGEVEDALRGELGDAFRGGASPQAIDAEAEHMVGDDVAPCDAGKGLSDVSGVLHGVA